MDALVTLIEAHENEDCGIGQTDPEDGDVSFAPGLRARKNRLSPKKLLLTKWTAVKPRNREKHFVVTRVIEPEPPSMLMDPHASGGTARPLGRQRRPWRRMSIIDIF